MEASTRLIVSLVTQEDYVAMENATRDLDTVAVIQQVGSMQGLLGSVASLKDPSVRPIIMVSSSLTNHRMRDLANQVHQASLFLPMIIIRDSESSPAVPASNGVVANPFNSVFMINSPIHRQAAMDVLNRANHLANNFYRLHGDVERFNKLSPSEIAIVRMATEGLPNKSIARRLDVSIKTVEKNRRTAYEKLEVTSAAEMASVVTFHRYCLPLTGVVPTSGASLIN